MLLDGGGIWMSQFGDVERFLSECKTVESIISYRWEYETACRCTIVTALLQLSVLKLLTKNYVGSRRCCL